MMYGCQECIVSTLSNLPSPPGLGCDFRHVLVRGQEMVDSAPPPCGAELLLNRWPRTPIRWPRKDFGIMISLPVTNLTARGALSDEVEKQRLCKQTS